MARKIKEAIITMEIERNYTKDEILEKYLNEIYFGGGAYGIKSAAKLFFQKDVSELNVAEGALLAGIPNRPEMYNPRRNLERSLQREKLVLAQMYKDGVIDEETYNKAVAHKFIHESNIKPNTKLDENTTVIYERKPKRNSTVPAYTDMVEEFLLKNFDENLLYTGGLKVYTPLDMKMQEVAEESFKNYPAIKNDKKLEGAMVTIESSTGNVVSIVGGKNYKIGNFNRATMARRQLGSSFKPLIYFTALKEGMEPNTIVEDSRIVFGNWAPRNYGNRTRDNVTLVDALDKSINMVSIKLLQKVGEKKLKEVVKATGAQFNIPNNLTAALGSFEGTPLNLARAYAPFSNGGYSVEPTFVTKIEDASGNTIYKANVNKDRVFESDAIGLMTYMLKSSVQNGTSRGAAVKDLNGNPIEQGGKTGTTNEARTVWFAGITPEYVTTIYLGYDDNKPQGKNATGGGLVTPLWKDYYQKLVDNKIYTPGKFEFLEDHIKNGDLIVQNLDLTTGLINNTESGRPFLLRKNKRELEYNGKYSSGISRFVRTQEVKNAERKDMGTQETSVTNDSIFNKLLNKQQ
jgi:penicillin-binding protein 1A